jgi:hypothetical protein
MVQLCVFALCAGACGDNGGARDAAPPADAPTDDGPVADAPPPAACEAAAQALSEELYRMPQGCSVVVRLDYQTRSLLAYQVVCGPYRSTDEATARATAQADTGYGETGAMLNPANPEDAYVFYLSPGDFGGAAAVSARTGLSLFGGSIIWGGNGEITYPSSWRPAAELGEMCPPSGGINAARGYDLNLGAELDRTSVDDIVAIVAQTAIPDAFWRGGYVFDAVVLLYPRSVGVLDPTTAEWVALVNGGWLE